MAYKQKGHYGKYSGNAKHSKHHMVNSWEEEDVKRGRQQMKEGHRGHAEALFDDAHGSYNYTLKLYLMMLMVVTITMVITQQVVNHPQTFLVGFLELLQNLPEEKVVEVD